MPKYDQAWLEVRLAVSTRKSSSGSVGLIKSRSAWLGGEHAYTQTYFFFAHRVRVYCGFSCYMAVLQVYISKRFGVLTKMGLKYPIPCNSGWDLYLIPSTPQHMSYIIVNVYYKTLHHGRHLSINLWASGLLNMLSHYEQNKFSRGLSMPLTSPRISSTRSIGTSLGSNWI